MGTSIVIMVALSGAFALILAIANKRLAVKEDPQVRAVNEFLPQLNCGGCGYPNCREFAAALVKDSSITEAGKTCRPGGEEAWGQITKLLGLEHKAVAKETAVVLCGADNSIRRREAVYKGLETCRNANLIFGGGISCSYGCMGFGDCKKACPFDAIVIVKGLPKVDPDKCTACGKCVEACPRDLMKVMPFESKEFAVPACSSRDKGPRVRKICKVGCIACKICEKLSNGVFVVENNVAVLRPEKITDGLNWEDIIKKCPTGTILRLK